MAKVIKLKQSDIEKIVESIIKENQEWQGSEDPEIRQMGQVGAEEVPGEEEDQASVELALGQDDQGNFYVIKNGDEENPEIVFKTN